jgi:hypothetical protein
MKTQLQELLDKGYISPSCSPRGCPTLCEEEGPGTCNTHFLHDKILPS